jgi:SAM-dependent methyltransferase
MIAAMLQSSRERILQLLSDDDSVLDVGGWAKPLPRADWVIDLLPYETRGLYGDPPDPERERFDASSWVQRDICDREPWPFADGQFDFVVCSHTLEDVRDPLSVCAEMQRVGGAGYVEVPSRLEEQAYGVQGPWVGWGHHRWLIDVGDTEIDFAFKHHVIHGRESDHFPAGFAESLSPEERVEVLWWEGSFRFRERQFADAAELDAYLAGFVSEHGPRRRRGAI